MSLPPLQIKDLLKMQGDEFVIFRHIYKRVLELCVRSETLPSIMKLAFDHQLKEERIDNIESLLIDYADEFDINNCECQGFVFFYAFSALFVAISLLCFPNIYLKATAHLTYKNDMEKVMNCFLALRDLENATSNISSFEFHNNNKEEAIKQYISKERSNAAKSKAAKQARIREPELRKIEMIWDKENWTDKGRGKYSNFAKHIIYNDLVEILEFDAIKNHISKYDKKLNHQES